MDRQARKNKPAHDPAFDDQQLDAEERELESMIAAGRLSMGSESERKRRVKNFYSAKAKRSVKKSVTMRLDGITLAVLKDQARTQGLRYQTLISSVLYKYITGELTERKR